MIGVVVVNVGASPYAHRFTVVRYARVHADERLTEEVFSERVGSQRFTDATTLPRPVAVSTTTEQGDEVVHDVTHHAPPHRTGTAVRRHADV